MFIIRIIILLIFPLIFSCAGGNHSSWAPYSFDGNNLSPANSTSSNAIWVQSGYLPITSNPTFDSMPSDRLPHGTGAVAGICYIQATGGKISRHNSFAPLPDEQITFKGKTGETATSKTDINGYFTEHLTAGDYELFCRGARAEFTVKSGETTLVPVRGGKRMAD